MIDIIQNKKIVIVVLTETGITLAKKISAELKNCEIHGLKNRVTKADYYFSDSVNHLRYLFDLGNLIIGVCAVGILVRAIASNVKDKKTDPPIIAISEDGKSIVPVLGGHSGANRLSRYLAVITGGHPAITTAGDLLFGISIDEPPEGWKIPNPEKVKSLVAGLLDGESVRIESSMENIPWIISSDLPISEKGSLSIKVTEKSIKKGERHLTFHPPILVLGVGCERGVTGNELIELVEKTLGENQLARESIACIVSIDLKMDESGIHQLADYLNLPTRFFTNDELESQTPFLKNPSDIVFSAVGCHGVSEGAAIAAVGRGGSLIVEKTKSEKATIAIAKSSSDIDIHKIGIARGKLNIVGLGPGKVDWRTSALTDAIKDSTHVVGYKLYLDLVEDLLKGKECFFSELSQEESRARKAIKLASSGHNVTLVCSGDAGIYALATLVFELIDRENCDDWNRIQIEVHPGISAFQAAAARVGAPMGHDFCAISLSNLLTSWKKIEIRIKAAAEGDFVIAFYNPVSKKRRIQLEKAKKIILKHRSKKTPVIVAKNVGRIGEKIRISNLEELNSEMADMLTIVIIGNSQSRIVKYGGVTKVYTPRGYMK